MIRAPGTGALFGSVTCPAKFTSANATDITTAKTTAKPRDRTTTHPIATIYTQSGHSDPGQDRRLNYRGRARTVIVSHGFIEKFVRSIGLLMDFSTVSATIVSASGCGVNTLIP